MSLFQKSVEKNYIKLQDTKEVEKAFKKYTKYFHNTTIQQNIRESKEEQFQEGFLRELFVNVFDYTLNPNPNFNLTTELKNEKGAKKTDGAILKDNQAIAVIELKSTKTKDLEKIRQQAFDYKANQSGCVYVITSNFEKLRFYINNAVDYEEFDLFTLNEQQFALLYLCLHKDSILSNKPLKIKQASVVEEESITKKFYANYSLFKRELYRDLVKENMKNDVFRTELQKEDTDSANKNIKRTLFKKSQKLIDRFLFIFFAEDRGLLPPNSTLKILEDWNKLSDLDAEVPLYNRFKLYFKYLDEGRKGTDKKAEIFAYNGGLFKPDSVLNSLIIDDKLLYKHTKALSDYDFESQVDVNILGHIFENSLNEIESINAEIEGVEFDKQTTKRKKDGVFYTPKYITKYIVDNTVGKLCTEKKAELNIEEEEYFKSRKGRPTKTLQALQQKLESYRNWMLTLTILDPACGSGAFLNQALDFLIKEHQYIDELQTKLLGGGFVFPNIENTVLENNIFGVDLNEESVEIAKLSLWLRTAQPRRKLNVLTNNIKCGNSLIDDPKVAGNKSFNWQNEFPEVFEKGGFDIVIGNPPYVRQELFKDIKPYLKENYNCYNSIADLYTYFIEKGIKLMNEIGVFSFILPNKFLKATYGKQIRKVIKEETNIELIFDFDDYPVFDDATTYPIIFVLSKKVSEKGFFNYSEINKRTITPDPIYRLELKKHKVSYDSLTDEMWNFIDIKNKLLLDKIKAESTYLKDVVNNKIFRGVSTGKNEVFIINEQTANKLINENNKKHIRKIVTGKEVKRYNLNFDNLYLLYIPWEYDLEFDAGIKEYLLENKEILSNRPEVKDGRFNWWCLSRYGSKNAEFLFEPKIIYPRINNECNFYFDEKGTFSLSDNNFFLATDEKFLLPILNSKVVFYFLKSIASTLQGGYLDFRRPYIEIIPIKIPNEKKSFAEIAELMYSLNNQLQDVLQKFQRTLCRKFELADLPKKLQNWNSLKYSQFIKELSKKKIKLTLSEEAELEEYFLQESKIALDLNIHLSATNNKIDQMVYELYGLTQEEIAIIEGNIKN